MASQNVGGGDLDALLTVFFQREMPDPWPAFTPPRGQQVAERRPPATLPLPARKPARRFRLGSRLALAASLALILGGTLLVPARLPAPPASSIHVTDGGSAERDPWGTNHNRQKAPPFKAEESLEQGRDGTTYRIKVGEAAPRQK